MARFLLLLVVLLAGCASMPKDLLSLPLVDTREKVAQYEGKKVRLVGVVSNTKIPQILGVDVEAEIPDMRGKQAEAYGILKRFIITADQVLEFNRLGIAHRGAGTFWRLYDPKKRDTASACEPAIVCIYEQKKSEPNQRPERNAGAASSSTSTPPPGVAHP